MHYLYKMAALINKGDLTRGFADIRGEERALAVNASRVVVRDAAIACFQAPDNGVGKDALIREKFEAAQRPDTGRLVPFDVWTVYSPSRFVDEKSVVAYKDFKPQSRQVLSDLAQSRSKEGMISVDNVAFSVIQLGDFMRAWQRSSGSVVLKSLARGEGGDVLHVLRALNRLDDYAHMFGGDGPGGRAQEDASLAEKPFDAYL